jgi:predicted nucleotidyltransferase
VIALLAGAQSILPREPLIIPMRPPARRYGTVAQPLDEILGTPARVRVLRALDRSVGPHPVTAIAKETGLTHNAVLSAVGILAGAGMVTEESLGARVVYQLNTQHPFAAPLIELFSAERARRQALSAAVEEWASAQPAALLAVWLFGSVARREDTFQSDIDLAVVAKTHGKAVRFAGDLGHVLAPVAQRNWLRPNVLAYDSAEILALPTVDSEMWSNLTRDAIALHGQRPTALRSRLEHQPTKRQ